MAAVVKCDSCGNCVGYKDAVHIRTYAMDSATTYKSSNIKHTADVCMDCYKKLCVMLGKGAK